MASMKLLVCLGLLCLAHFSFADNNLCGGIKDDRTQYDNAHTVQPIAFETDSSTGFTFQDLMNSLDTKGNIKVAGNLLSSTGTKVKVEIERMGDFGPQTTLPSLRVKFVQPVDKTAPAVLYKGMDRLLLDKNPNDPTRLHNKLAFELLQDVNNMVSQVTTFHTVTVNGEDMGFYTLIEDMRKEMLVKHGMGKDSNMYKANNVSWNLAIDSTVLPLTSPLYDEKKFELYWDVRGEKKDHNSLINAYTDVFDANADPATVMSTRFNADNFASWLAFVYLIAHHDLDGSSYGVYAPLGSTSCRAPTPLYMMLWDNSGAWDPSNVNGSLVAGVDYAKHTKGIQYLYNNLRIVKKFLQVDAYVELFEAKMKSLAEGRLSASSIKTITDDYKSKIRSSLDKTPDSNVAYNTYGGNIDLWASNVDLLSQIPANQWQNWEMYKKSPMPFSASKGYSSDSSSIIFRWEKSFILYNKPIVYELEIADSETFANVLFKASTNKTFITVPAASSFFAASTTYYWRVIAYNEQERTFSMPSKDSLKKNSGFGISDMITRAELPALTEATAASITNKQAVSSPDGHVFNFATLDNISPTDLSINDCVSDSWLTIPDGWFLAPNTLQTKYLVNKMSQPFGGAIFVLADGTRMAHDGKYVDGFGDDNMSLDEKALVGDKKAYAPRCTGTANRVLLVDSLTAVDVPVIPTSTTTGTSSDAHSNQVVSIFLVALCFLAALL